MISKEKIDTYIENERSREPEDIIRFSDDEEKYEAILVIDCLKNGSSSGGIRISDSIDLDEIIALARSMTLKYGILQRMRGGAKCGIQLPKNCTTDQRKRILTTFGKGISSLLQNNTYIPYMDMNCSKEDVFTILSAARCPKYPISDSSYFTALSIFSSVKAACHHNEQKMKDKTCIIQGFGNVGSHIGRFLVENKVKIIGISTKKGAIYNNKGFEIQSLIDQRNTHGDDLIFLYPDYLIEPKSALIEQEVDILIPCAQYHSINKKNMKNITATIIAPGANNAYEEDVESYLTGQNQLCLPDFVSNIGGIIGTSLFDNQVLMNDIQRYFDHDFNHFIRKLLNSSKKCDKTPFEIAYVLAQINHYHLIQKQKRIKKEVNSARSDSVYSSLVTIVPNMVQSGFFFFNEKRIMMKNRRILDDICRHRLV